MRRASSNERHRRRGPEPEPGGSARLSLDTHCLPARLKALRKIGVPEKGMITWKGVLKPDQVLAVASHIDTLRETKPANPKPPEKQAGTQPAVNVYE